MKIEHFSEQRIIKTMIFIKKNLFKSRTRHLDLSYKFSLYIVGFIFYYIRPFIYHTFILINVAFGIN